MGIGRKNDDNFRTMIEVAVKNQKPVRIGVNWGSLDQPLLTRMMDENARARRAEGRARSDDGSHGRRAPWTPRSWRRSYGLRADQIILSAKVSGVQDLIDVYRALAARCDYALHLGLTEAGMGAKGIVASTAGARACCCRKASATPFASRLRPLRVATAPKKSIVGAADPAVDGHSQLHPAGDRLPGLRTHHQHVLPGNGRADPELPARADADRGRAAMPAWKR